MGTIRAMEHDVMSQVAFLNAFRPQRKTRENALFCGSGDSLASCMMAESFSDYAVQAVDPLDLAKNKKISKNRHVYFVSISGNTVSNVRAAQSAKTSTAITKNCASKLAKSCNNAICLDYADSGVMTAGSVSFLASMLTCVSLVFSFRIKNAKRIFAAARSKAKKVSLKNKVYFVGNQHTYPICMYAAAKLHEVLGMDAHYERMEQFSHMGLFSAKPGDTVVLFEEKSEHGKHLASELKKVGLSVYHPSIKSDKISQAIFYTFVSQFLALNLAKRKRLSECYFIKAKKIRNASSSMIY